jgi:hypothetical protein
MAATKKPTAIVQWWRDKRSDLQRQLALARESGNAREALQIRRSIERIDLVLRDMKR